MATLPDFAGIKVYRKAQETGTYVGLYDGEAAGMDTDGGRWQTVCEAHGWIISHPTRALAEAFLSHPLEWCERCENHEPPDGD